MDKHWAHDAQFVKHFEQPWWPITRHSAAPSHGHCPCRLSACWLPDCTLHNHSYFYFNVPDPLSGFRGAIILLSKTWCQDQVIKSFSSSHGCRRQPGPQKTSTQFEGELGTHRDWNWWQLLFCYLIPWLTTQMAPDSLRRSAGSTQSRPFLM